MSDKADTRILPPLQDASDAFCAYQAVVRQLRAKPSLVDDPAWQARKAAAFEVFERAFGGAA